MRRLEVRFSRACLLIITLYVITKACELQLLDQTLPTRRSSRSFFDAEPSQPSPEEMPLEGVRARIMLLTGVSGDHDAPESLW